MSCRKTLWGRSRRVRFQPLPAQRNMQRLGGILPVHLSPRYRPPLSKILPCAIDWAPTAYSLSTQPSTKPRLHWLTAEQITHPLCQSSLVRQDCVNIVLWNTLPSDAIVIIWFACNCWFFSTSWGSICIHWCNLKVPPRRLACSGRLANAVFSASCSHPSNECMARNPSPPPSHTHKHTLYPLLSHSGAHMSESADECERTESLLASYWTMKLVMWNLSVFHRDTHTHMWD